MDLVFASHNDNKLKEIEALLPNGYGLRNLNGLGYSKEIDETADTIEGNARLKAHTIFEEFDIPCFADDTGLEVKSLGGEPGVYSARYAGKQKSSDDNMNLLLERLASKTDRTAQFKTVISYFDPSGNETQFIGTVKGKILKERKGDGGFGYDPIFLPDGFSKSFAEMDLEQKNLISHRALAFKKFIEFLNNQ